MNHTLDSVIKSYLILKGDMTEHKYFRMLDIAISGMRELSQDVNPVKKVVEIDIQDNNTIDLPNDYMDYTFIGVDANGQLVSLGLNNGISKLTGVDDCGDPTLNNVDTDGVAIPLATRNGQTIGKMYGMGGGSNEYGYFRVDLENSRIILDLYSGFPYTTIVMEYICDPSLIDDKTEVHSYDVDALKAYMWYYDILTSRTRPMNEKMMAKDNWYNLKRMAKQKHKSFTLEEAAQSIRKSLKQSPKL